MSLEAELISIDMLRTHRLIILIRSGFNQIRTKNMAPQ